jgi:multidrug efflux pump subunit AcrA (membrane-fusion protein)
VYVITEANKVEERIVTLGETVGDRVELASGVKTGERVATNPRGKLSDGTRVQIEG